MKVVILLAALVWTVHAVPITEEERVNGVNGWHVPQADGSYRWITLEEGEQMLEDAEQPEDDVNPASRGAISTVPVTFYLYTNKNPTKAQQISESSKSIKNSDFDPSNPTRFIIHGWRQFYNAGMFKDLRDAFLARNKYNVILVDWGRARSVEYVSSVSAIPKTGEKIASLIDYLVENYGMNLDETEVIGHSLGAQVSGFTGKNVKNGKLHAIVALDAALPLFSYNKPEKRLNADDAHYVECIHTNGGAMGFLESIGKADFYPNGGKNQPGCGWDIRGVCDHQRSVTYYTEAVVRDSFPSMRCGDYKEAVKKSCGATYSSVKMGAESNAYVVTGEYYVPVNKASPFGLALGAQV